MAGYPCQMDDDIGAPLADVLAASRAARASAFDLSLSSG